MRLNPLRVIKMFEAHPEWVDYEPETLWTEVAETSKQVPGGMLSLSRPAKDMIMAVKLCFGSHAPYSEWEVFENVVAAMNNETPLIDHVQELFVAEVAFAVECMRRISKNVFSDEVKGYIAAVAQKDGLIMMPNVLLFAQGNLSGMSKSTDEMVKKVAKEWALQSIRGKKEDIDYDDFVSIHCGKLHDIKTYVNFYGGKILKGEK